MLLTIGGLASVGLAGCTGGGNGGSDGGNGSSDGGNGDGSNGDDGAGGGTESGAEYVDQASDQVSFRYGDTATLSNGVEVTVHGLEIQERLGDERPEERDEFALLEIEAVNGGDEQARLPDPTDPGLQLLFEDQQIDPTFNYAAFDATEYEPYEGGDVQPGVRREGYILYETTAGLSQSDIDFLWQDDLFVVENLDGEIDARWTAG